MTGLAKSICRQLSKGDLESDNYERLVQQIAELFTHLPVDLEGQ